MVCNKSMFYKSIFVKSMRFYKTTLDKFMFYKLTFYKSMFYKSNPIKSSSIMMICIKVMCGNFKPIFKLNFIYNEVNYRYSGILYLIKVYFSMLKDSNLFIFT